MKKLFSKKKPKSLHTKRRVRHNFKPALLLLLIPIVVGGITIQLIVGNSYGNILGQSGAERLVTANWESADRAFADHQPAYERQHAFYKVRERQNLASVAAFFSVDQAELARLNPGTIAAGTTVKIPPIQKPLDAIGGANGKIFQAKVIQNGNMLRIVQDYKLEQALTTIPELMTFLQPYGAIEQTGPKEYRLNKAISIEDNVRVDITDVTVTKLQLRSSPDDATCLCFDGSAALIKNVEITSVDPVTNLPDKKVEDQRSFVRAKAARLDIINSKLSYLGNELQQTLNANKLGQPAIQREGGVYGVSWRISDDSLGKDIATGWVENSTFFRNHFGAFTFGASGMMWKGNRFVQNDVYGLDPHDDSNNALIENNVFEHNGKHGFIVSKRCNYNIIRNNVSFDNKLHGYMLHEQSVYNVIENNVAYNNTDNYVIYGSDYNTIRSNTSYNARSSHVRINQKSRNTYVMNNKLYGTGRGVYVYGDSQNVYVADNEIRTKKEALATAKAQNILFARNSIDALSYKIADGDRLIFGINQVKKQKVIIPVSPPTPRPNNATTTDDREDTL